MCLEKKMIEFVVCKSSGHINLNIKDLIKIHC